MVRHTSGEISSGHKKSLLKARLIQKRTAASKDATLKLDSSLFNQSFLMRKANSMKKQNQRIIQELVQSRQYTTKVENMNHMFRKQQADLLIKLVHSEEAAKRLLAENNTLKNMLKQYGHNFATQSLDASDCAVSPDKNTSLVGYNSLHRGNDDTFPSYVCMSVLDNTSCDPKPSPQRQEKVNSEIKDLERSQSPKPPPCSSDEDSHNTAVNEAFDDSMMSLKLSGSSESSFLSNCSSIDDNYSHDDKSKETTSLEQPVIVKEQNKVIPGQKRNSKTRNDANNSLAPSNFSNILQTDDQDKEKKTPKPKRPRNSNKEQDKSESMILPTEGHVQGNMASKPKRPKNSNKKRVQSDSFTVLPADCQNQESIVSKPKRLNDSSKKQARGKENITSRPKKAKISNKNLDESAYDLFSISKDSFIVDDDKRVKLPLAERNGEPRRASRARKTVSYAEPSLHAKLRRGDKFTDGSICKSFSPQKSKRKTC